MGHVLRFSRIPRNVELSTLNTCFQVQITTTGNHGNPITFTLMLLDVSQFKFNLVDMFTTGQGLS